MLQTALLQAEGCHLVGHDPHSKGGRSEIENASLMCRKHNSAKGNKTNRRKAA